MTKLSQNSHVNTFGERLSEKMKKAGLSAYKLALEAKMDSGLLYKILDGKRSPSDDVLRKLNSITELDIDYDTLRYWKLIDEIGAAEFYSGFYRAIKEMQDKKDKDFENKLAELPPEVAAMARYIHKNFDEIMETMPKE